MSNKQDKTIQGYIRPDKKSILRRYKIRQGKVGQHNARQESTIQHNIRQYKAR